jgi:hypothetical protein
MRTLVIIFRIGKIMTYDVLSASGAVLDAIRPRTSGMPQNAYTMKLQKEPVLDFERMKKIVAGVQSTIQETEANKEK